MESVSSVHPLDRTYWDGYYPLLPPRGRGICTGISFSSLSLHRQFAVKSYHFFCLSMVSATCYGELWTQNPRKAPSPAACHYESRELVNFSPLPTYCVPPENTFVLQPVPCLISGEAPLICGCSTALSSSPSSCTFL